MRSIYCTLYLPIVKVFLFTNFTKAHGLLQSSNLSSFYACFSFISPFKKIIHLYLPIDLKFSFTKWAKSNSRSLIWRSSFRFWHFLKSFALVLPYLAFFEDSWADTVTSFTIWFELEVKTRTSNCDRKYNLSMSDGFP